MTFVLTFALAIPAAAAGPWLRGQIFAHSVAYSQPLRCRCPRCHHQFGSGWRTRLPPDGRCPLCRRRIGPATGVVEMVAATVTAAVAWQTSEPLVLAAMLWIAAHGIILSFVDAAVHRLPDHLTALAFLGATALLAAASAAAGSWGRLLTALASAGILAGIYFIVVLAKPEALGLGDVKLASTAGLALGWLSPAAAIVGLFAATAIGAIAGISLLAARRLRRGQAFAHGPVLLTATLAAYLLAA